MHGCRSTPIHFFNYTWTGHTAGKTLSSAVSLVWANCQSTFRRHFLTLSQWWITFKWFCCYVCWHVEMVTFATWLGFSAHPRAQRTALQLWETLWMTQELNSFKFASHIQNVSPCLSTTGGDLQNPPSLPNTDNHRTHFTGLAKAANKPEPAPFHCLREAI